MSCQKLKMPTIFILTNFSSFIYEILNLDCYLKNKKSGSFSVKNKGDKKYWKCNILKLLVY